MTSRFSEDEQNGQTSIGRTYEGSSFDKDPYSIVQLIVVEVEILHIVLWYLHIKWNSEMYIIFSLC